MIFSIDLSNVDEAVREVAAQLGQAFEPWWKLAVGAWAHKAYQLTPPDKGSDKVSSRDAPVISLVKQAQEGKIQPIDRQKLEARPSMRFKVVKTGLYDRRKPYFTEWFHGYGQAKKAARITTRGLAKLSWLKGLDQLGVNTPRDSKAKKLEQARKRARGSWKIWSSAGTWLAECQYGIDYLKPVWVFSAAWKALEGSLQNSLDRFNQVKGSPRWTGRSRFRREK